MDTEISYNPKAKATFPLLEEMWVERGDSSDWDLLSGLHYKMSSLPVGAKFWRVVFRDETVGVSVISMSKPLLKERHALFPLFKPGRDTQISNIRRYDMINDNFRVVGRFVIDTMFRSGGVAYRLLNLSARMQDFRYIEIQSSMAAYNPFAAKAGFRMVKPMRSPFYDKGMKFMRRWFSAHPGDTEALMEEFNKMPESIKPAIEKVLKEFYYDNSSLEKTGARRHYSGQVVDNWDVRRTISKIQGLCFSSPIYGVYDNPDFDRELPKRIPLLAFDTQKPNEKLITDFTLLPGYEKIRKEIEHG